MSIVPLLLDVGKIKESLHAFKKLKKDKARFVYIIEHKDIFKLMLDNDCTQVGLSEKSYKILLKTMKEDDIDEMLDEFDLGVDEYIGHSDGVFILLDVIGIECEGV